MKTYNTSCRLSLVVTALVISLTACSTVGKNHVSYLKDTGMLKPEVKDKRALVWRTPEAVSPRSSFAITNLQWAATNAEILPAERSVLINRLSSALTTQFASHGGQVNGRGPARVEIRGAITGVSKANVPLNVLASLVLNFPVIMGGIAVELEAVSKPDGKPLASAQYIIPGRPWQMVNSLTKLGQARSGLDLVAAKFYTLVTGEKALVEEQAKLKMNPLKR
jgi:hypothetical protein